MKEWMKIMRKQQQQHTKWRTILQCRIYLTKVNFYLVINLKQTKKNRKVYIIIKENV